MLATLRRALSLLGPDHRDTEDIISVPRSPDIADAEPCHTQVFERLKSHGLKLQPQKCRLFQQEVRYLGHIVSRRGVATDPEKTAAVQDWPAPQTVKQVRSFLGFAGYYRRFIPGVPFRVYIDASLEGLGAVLSQVQDGQERVIAYASRSLHPAERNDRNYSSFKLELLGLKWAITETFKDYLWGADIEVFTDNNPLVHLATANLGATEQRWAAQLANYRYTIKYRPGARNGNADGLSRRPEKAEVRTVRAASRPASQEVTTEPSESRPEGVGPELLSSDRWRKAQQADPSLRQLYAWKEQRAGPTKEVCSTLPRPMQKLLAEWAEDEIQHGVLVRRVKEPYSGMEACQILVPTTEAKEVW
ncbi:hypothetical protein ACEWY4_013369 [Coilia grayii]|uniref:Reverse transcriptase RNase H-like domain-containing protein n=1 Tax=Coilia grayii TaxID=363190 RepID=A0ABD1JW47_9TELE